jgi:hemoglobin/transferrin/lactoferrin receptor protein
MNRFWLLIFVSIVAFSFNSKGQNFHLQGVVFDSLSHKTLEDVLVEVTSLESENKGHYVVVTDIKGGFSLNIPSGYYRLIFRNMGYSLYEVNVPINNDIYREIYLAQQPFSLGEIIVSSFRENRKVKEMPISLAIVNSLDFRNQSALTLSNVLANEPGINLGSDGPWATNINIRGFSENRLVTLVDGHRIETATDLTASLSLIDVNDIERVEVVKGAQSVLYGTGAMGGVVNIITKDGYFANGHYVSGNFFSGYASANQLLTGNAAISTGSDKWHLRLSGTYTDANDIRTPQGVLANSQFKANNIAARFGVKPFINHLFNVQYQRYWANDVGVPGGESFPGPATATYSEIGRQLVSASYEILNISEKFTSLKLTYFNQYILRNVDLYPNMVSEVDLPNGNLQQVTPELITPTGKHFTHGVQLQSTWSIRSNNTLIAGVDLWSRSLSTKREKFIRVNVFDPQGNLLITNNLVRGEIPNPGSTFASAGIFVHNETHMLNERLTLILGSRIDGVRVVNEQGFDIDYLIVNGERNDTPPNQRITFNQGAESSISWSANAGVLYGLSSDVDASINLARSFRAPSLEERFKYIDLGNMVRMGDPTLNPESGYSLDMGVRIWNPGFTFQFGAFLNWLSEMIVEIPGDFAYTINTGPQEGITDTIAALINANVSKALLYGSDMGFQYKVFTNFVLFGSGSYVRGQDIESNSNLPQIPPMKGRLGVRYTHPLIGSVQLSLIGASKQDKVGVGELATEGYLRWDIGLNSAKFNLGLSKIQFFTGIDNLMDKSYTNHLATNRGAISVEPGRNLYLKLYISF